MGGLKMLIAVSTNGIDLNAQVDPRFGRCSYFLIVNSDTMEFETLTNSEAMAGGGAGISTSQAVAGKGVEVILTGNCGPNAYQALSTVGIKVVTGVSGKVQDVIEAFKEGKYQESTQPNVTDHFGTPRGRGMGMGRGLGPRWVS